MASPKLNRLSKLSLLIYYWIYLDLEIFFTVFSASAASSLTQSTVDSSQLKLQLAQVLFRHGDRNPVNPYPNDPYKNESYWPEGLAQLTKVGKMQQYELGVFLRQRYKEYLSIEYSPYEIHVESSDVDRTLMSAEANLAGLYPPDSKTQWKSDLDWQPIPVHTVPVNDDNKLKMNAPCPYYDNIQKDFLTNSPVMKEVNAENQNLYNYLETHSGRNIRNPEDVDFLYDTLFIESLHNYKLPNWTQSVFPGPNSPMHNLTAFSFLMLTYTTEMQRLKGGPLIKEMLQNMRDRIAKKLDTRRKMFMYSAHDTTVAAFLNTLNVFDIQTPPYASLVTVELFKKSSSEDFFVQISYRNDTTREPYVLKIPGCESYCPFDKLVELTNPVIPLDWKSECQKGSTFSALSLSVLATGGILAVMLLLSILSMLYLRHIRNNPKAPAYPYLHLQMEDEDA